MKTFFCKPTVTLFLLLPFIFLLFSCSGDDYLNAIPENSIAIVAVDMKQLTEHDEDNPGINHLKEMFKVDDLDECGIGLSEKLYIFETTDGNVGLVAKVADKGNLETWLNKMAESGFCEKTSKRKDCQFTVMKDSWVTGFSSEALMIIGPILPVGQAEVRQQILKYLEQDDEQSIKASPLFDKLNTIDSPIAFVAQVSALPDKFVAPFTIGAPKDADASQIMLVAAVKKDKDILEVTGEPFSFNKNIDNSLKEAYQMFRPIKGKYLESMPSGAFLGAFMNVEGKDFIKLLHANTAFQGLLTGVNMAIDMDNIIKSINGDMAVVMPAFSDDGTQIRLSAQLGNKDFLKDISYWKQSCPAGSKIEDCGKDSYCYTNGSMSYYFGVSEDMQYYSGSTPDEARNSILKATKTLPSNILSKLKGQRLCFVLNVGVLARDDKSGLLSNVITPLFGDINYILYNVK